MKVEGSESGSERKKGRRCKKSVKEIRTSRLKVVHGVKYKMLLIFVMV